MQAFATWRDRSSGGALFAGASLSKFWGSLGLRLGGAAHPVSTQTQPLNSSRIGAWVADADLIFEPLRKAPDLKPWLFGFSLYVFGGMGGYHVTRSAVDTNYATLSYGMGVYHDLVGPFAIQTEARYRTPLESDAGFAATSRQRLEYSLAARLNFGPRRKVWSDGNGPAPAPAPRQPAARSSEMASRVLDEAETYLNTPYRLGGTTPQAGFDAAGFVRYVFGKAQFELGIEGAQLPQTSRDLAKLGEQVPLRIGAVRPGDLLFFAADGRHVDHVAIYVGHDRIIHSSASGGGVRYDVLGDGERGRWFADHLVSARRLTGPQGSKGSDTGSDATFDPPDPAPAPIQ